ncbi:E3 ubiquitin-protein ligase TRIM71-like [Limulus polyphemus]|uniref:E3 ubiquitin-protein ligase TRIM71-like n=1 Tax=Limulus polyphemus TaxID=6850 RepID=A0ABM1B470_LIMPO|nr:E3 ubiquitin-protein ligase TRIM71-like [Limulus polyphemus]
MSDASSSFHSKVLFDPQSFTLDTEIEEFCTEGKEESDTSSVVLHPAPSGEEARNEYSNPNQKDWVETHSRLYRSKSFVPKVNLGTNQLQRPSGIAVSPWSDEVFVVIMDNHRVAVFDINTGKYLRFFGRRGHKPGEFLCPFGVALSQTEQTILVTDKWKHCIHVFRKDGKFQKQIGIKGRSSGHFRSPESIAVDQYGTIYVCDTCNDRIQVFDKEGAFVREMGVKSLTEGDSVRQRSMFHQPTGIAVTPDGQRVVVSDFGNHRIHVFSSDGDLLFTFGQKGTQRGQFIHPECVAVDKKGFVFVGDSGNGRVQICRPDGRFIRSFGSKGSHSGQFSWISGIAVTDNYDIIVTDFKNHCVQIF